MTSDGVVHKIDMAAVGVVQITAIAATYVAFEIDDIIPDDNRFFRRSHGGTDFEYGSVVGIACYVHHIVFDDAVVSDSQQVDGVIVGKHVVGMISDGVAP